MFHQSCSRRRSGHSRAGSSLPRPGARGATVCAGRRAAECARAQQRRRLGAPACAESSGQTLFSSSVELRLVKRRRPPPPPRASLSSPPLPRATDRRAGRPLKGNAAPFPCPSSAPGIPGTPRDPRAPGRRSLGPHDGAPRVPRPPGASRQDAHAAPPLLGTT